MAGLLFVYFTSLYIDDDRSLIVSIILVTVYAHLILRLRFKLAFPVSLIYFLATLIIYGMGGTDKADIIDFSVMLTIGYISISTGGYFLEKTSRDNYIKSKLIEKQQEELKLEHEKSESLLLNILPEAIANRLKEDSGVIADNYDSSSVLFADIVGFTQLADSMSAKEVVKILNALFSKFDSLVEKLEVEKIKTIGDAYMVISGLPAPNANHATALFQLGKEMLRSVEEFNRESGQNISIRIGMNSGPVVAGVIGKKKFLYDLWGDTVNMASRMESQGVSGRIHFTENTMRLLDMNESIEDCGFKEIKGKGKIHTYLF